MASEPAQRRGLNPVLTLGGHTNGRMASFHAQTPSGFELEYGTGGITIDDEEASGTASGRCAGAVWGPGRRIACRTTCPG